MHQEREKGGKKREFWMFQNPGSKGHEMELSPEKVKKKFKKKKKDFFCLPGLWLFPPFAEVKLPKLQKRGKTIENREKMEFWGCFPSQNSFFFVVVVLVCVRKRGGEAQW